jgi:cAMP phosphodiesterase
MAISKVTVSSRPKVQNIEDFEVLGVDKSTGKSAKADMVQLKGNMFTFEDLTPEQIASLKEEVYLSESEYQALVDSGLVVMGKTYLTYEDDI